MKLRHIGGALGAAALGVGGILALATPSLAVSTSPAEGQPCGIDGSIGTPALPGSPGSAGEDAGTKFDIKGVGYTCQSSVKKTFKPDGTVDTTQNVWAWAKVVITSPTSAPASSAPASSPAPSGSQSSSARPSRSGSTRPSPSGSITHSGPIQVGPGDRGNHGRPIQGGACGAEEHGVVQWGDRDTLRCGSVKVGHNTVWQWTTVTTTTTVTDTPCAAVDLGAYRVHDRIMIACVGQTSTTTTTTTTTTTGAAGHWVKVSSPLASTCATGDHHVARLDHGIALRCGQTGKTWTWIQAATLGNQPCAVDALGARLLYGGTGYECTPCPTTVSLTGRHWTTYTVTEVAPTTVQVGSPCDKAKQQPVLVNGQPCDCQAVPVAPATPGATPSTVDQIQPVTAVIPIQHVADTKALPVTGSSTVAIAATGLVLIAGGAGLWMVSRRRKIRTIA